MYKPEKPSKIKIEHKEIFSVKLNNLDEISLPENIGEANNVSCEIIEKYGDLYVELYFTNRQEVKNEKYNEQLITYKEDLKKYKEKLLKNIQFVEDE